MAATVRHLVCWMSLAAASSSLAQTPEGPRTSFRVRYVAADSVYLDAGRDAGLAEGFRLTIRRAKPGEPAWNAPVVAEAVVISIAANSAACELKSQTTAPEVGDTAILSSQDSEVLQMLQASRTARRYAQVVSFSEGDPIEEEARKYVPRPKLPEINRARGRISYEFNSITDNITHNAGSMQNGMVFRGEITRIAGTFWNFTGYYRARTNTRQNGNEQTLTDLINRTYHIGVYYNNPESPYQMGFGRMLLPWANSLSTIDGGYFARRFGRRITSGVFAGSTPDPTAWNYNPNRQLTGVFVNTEAGTFERLRYTGTAGLAMSRLAWKAEREYAFFENTLVYKTRFSLFHNLEADRITQGRFGAPRSRIQLTRSFLTGRVQLHRRLELDVSHNHFEGVPTFDTRLIGTGLLDKFLFQGLSGGARLELPGRLTLYGSIGRNKREGEASPSWNRMYGATVNNWAGTGLRIDFRWSKFNSSFGQGQFYTGSVSRQLSDRLRLDFQGGKQNITSPLAGQTRSIFLSSSVDWLFGDHYSLGFGHTMYRGKVQNYDQLFTNIGYRF